MRFDDYYEESFNNQAWLWEQSLRNAMNGRRGQQALRDLRDELLEMPVKELIGDSLSDGKGVCTVGAFVIARRMKRDGVTREQAVKDLFEQEVADQWDPEFGFEDTYEIEQRTIACAVDVGLAKTLAVELAFTNDLFYKATPEERYQKVLAWVEKRIIEEPVAA